ncbi:MAG: hypothetical protein F6K26_06015 [Moorea sp. SIO2I5]|nr:hypothetical protein [Moorena sp. SIO2I5]
MGGTPKTALPSQDRAASLPRKMPIPPHYKNVSHLPISLSPYLPISPHSSVLPVPCSLFPLKTAPFDNCYSNDESSIYYKRLGECDRKTGN